MKNNFDRNYIYITLACVASCFIFLTFEYNFTGGQMGVPLDDTWIHFRFADNFANGNFFEYNTGEPTAGTTSPLYVIVLGTTSLLMNNFILSSILISSLFFFLSCIFVYKISLLLFNSAHSLLYKVDSNHLTAKFLSLVAALLTVFTGRFVWSALSGMETTMFTFFCLAGVFFYIKNLRDKKFTYFPVLFFSLATVSRPEGFLIFSIYLADEIANRVIDKTFGKRKIKLIITILIFSIITFPYLIFSYNLSGHFFPNTFRGQGGGLNLIPDFNYLRISMIYFFRDNFITGLIYIILFIFYLSNIKKYSGQLRYLNMIILWIFLLPVVSSVLIPNWRHHVRYLMPLIPFINIIAVYFLIQFATSEFLQRVRKFILNKKIIVSSLFIFSFIYYIVYAIALGKNTDNINNQQLKLANWVNKNVSRDEVIALNDIGAITFINKNRIIDMAGLVTPEILKYYSYNIEDRLDSVNYLLKKNNVSYIIIYDDWYREYLNKYGNNLTFITSAYLEENTICGGDEMKVYKTHFQAK